MQEGLLPRPQKLNRTRASYGEEHLEWLAVIQRFQALGFPLRLLKRAVEQWGHGPEALERLKRSGTYQAIPESGLGGGVEPGAAILEPVTLSQLVKNTRLTASQVRRLERWGVLRPKKPGRYDASDQELAAAIRRILDDEVPLDELAFYRDFLPIARQLIQLSHGFARRHMDTLRRREVGVRELGRPLIRVIDYLLLRTAFEVTPNLSEILLADADFPDEGDGARGSG